MTATGGVSAKQGSRVVTMPARSTVPGLLARFSTRLPLVRRLRLAAPQLELRIGEITAAVLDIYLHKRGH
jgi:hypothetical protein